MNEPAVEILLVQHDQHQVEVTLDVLRSHRLANRIHVARDGAEALEFLFCSGAYAGREPENPRLVLLDLELAYSDNLEVLRQIKRDARTSHIPVTVLAPCSEDRGAAMRVLRQYDLQVPVVVIDGSTRDEVAHALSDLGGAADLEDTADRVSSSVGVARDATTPCEVNENRVAPLVGLGELCQERELESLAQLARGIAHEFNNLFSVIVAYTELLLNDMDLDDPRRKGADEIFKSIARASKLTRQLLAFTADTTKARLLDSSAAPAARPANRNGKAVIESA
jgi:CheY-like chemotaxis protein